MTFTIPGDPIAWARVGNSRSKFIFYDTQKMIKRRVMNMIIEQNVDKNHYEGPCHLDITFHFKIPQSMSSKKIETMVGKPHVSRPDIDNVVKFILDVASMKEDKKGNGILFNDDCIIASMNVKKVYAIEPCTIFTLTEIK